MHLDGTDKIYHKYVTSIHMMANGEANMCREFREVVLRENELSA